MKKFIITVAIAAGISGFSLLGGAEAKADYRTLHGVADIIEATGSLVNGGYSTTVYYDPYPVYYEPVYYRPAPRRYYDNYNHHYRPRHRSYYHCY